MTVNPDLHHANGLNPQREKLVLTRSLAIVVTVAIKVVGVLLIGATLIVPTAAARPLVRTREAMALAADAIGTISASLELYAAYLFNTPFGPSMVCVATVIFAIINLVGAFRPVG